MDLYIQTLKKYVVFQGRASRKEFWTFALINILLSFILGFIEGLTGMSDGTTSGPISGLFSLATFLPTIAVSVRRMHDVNKSGWFSIIPFYGLYLALKKGDVGSNTFGPAPKI